MEATEHNRQPITDLQRTLVEAIEQQVAESPLNRLKDIDGSPIFEEPLIGFADGDDPIFDVFKKAVGEFHFTPREALVSQVQSLTGAEPPVYQHLGVVSWVLPIARQTRLSNSEMTEGPSRRWNNARFQGEDFNDDLRRHVVSLLQDRGFVAVAPMLANFFRWVETSRGFASTWSERHVAHAAGHGTFSLSEGLITAKGIAHRIGSVVVNAEFVPSLRQYSSHTEYCPYLNDGTCGVCIKRCPAGAIGPTGHDKKKCHEFLFVTQLDWTKKPGYMGFHSGCGLCQTGVPCESGIPSRIGAS